MAYREQFCKRWFGRYLPIMESYERREMVEIPPALAGHESKIVPVFHNEGTFNSNVDQRYCRFDKDEQILKLKIHGRELMISKFVCPCHGRMVDPDTGEPSRVILKYGKN